MSTDAVSLGQGRCLRATDKAIFVSFENEDGAGMWIPQSVVHDDSEVYEVGQEGDVIVKRWWAEERGLA